MLTIERFNLWADYSLSDLRVLIPEVPTKLIRNLTDRSFLVLQNAGDPRLYTLANALEAKVYRAVGSGGFSYRAAKLMAAGAVSRAETRISEGTIGTDENRLTMLGWFSSNEENDVSGMQVRLAVPGDLPEFYHDLISKGQATFQVLAVDKMIEELVDNLEKLRKI